MKVRNSEEFLKQSQRDIVTTKQLQVIDDLHHGSTAALKDLVHQTWMEFVKINEATKQDMKGDTTYIAGRDVNVAGKNITTNAKEDKPGYVKQILIRVIAGVLILIVTTYIIPKLVSVWLN